MRVLVTRAKDDAERTAQKIAARGHNVIVAPIIEIVPTGDPAPEGRWDGLVVTSAHAVETLSAAADRRLRAFAVGERTAQALRAAGFLSVDVADGDAASLSRLIRGCVPPGHALLHATARHHKEEPAASLRAAGYDVIQWEAYEARAVHTLSPLAAEALRSGQIGAALHYSRRSADLFIRLTEGAGLTSTLSAFPHLCLSADVAAPLESVGASCAVAAEPSEDALLALLDGFE